MKVKSVVIVMTPDNIIWGVFSKEDKAKAAIARWTEALPNPKFLYPFDFKAMKIEGYEVNHRLTVPIIKYVSDENRAKQS
jgi:hypothetical protein